MARKTSGPVAAAIDIGSNSVHVLAARARRPVRDGARIDLETLADASDLIGLGDTVDGGGMIPPDALQAESIRSTSCSRSRRKLVRHAS